MSREERVAAELEALNTPAPHDDGVISVACSPTDGFNADGSVRVYFGG